MFVGLQADQVQPASNHQPAFEEFHLQHLHVLQVGRKRAEFCKCNFPKKVISNNDNLICPYLKVQD